MQQDLHVLKKAPVMVAFPRLCPLGHPEASAEAPARDRSAAVDQRSQQCTTLVGDEGLALLSRLQSIDIVLPTTDGHESRLRRITESGQKSLLHGSALPSRTVRIQSQM